MKFSNIFIPLILLICLNYGFAVVFLTIRNGKERIEFDEIGINVYSRNDKGVEYLKYRYHYMVNDFVESRGNGPISKPILKIDLPADNSIMIIHYKGKCKNKLKSNFDSYERTKILTFSTWEMALAQLELTRINVGATNINNQTFNFELSKSVKIWTYDGETIPFDHIFNFYTSGEFSLVGSNRNGEKLLEYFPERCKQSEGEVRCEFFPNHVRYVIVTKDKIEFMFFEKEGITYIVEKDHTHPFVAFLRAFYGEKIQSKKPLKKQ
jgi:hypothetical protein